MLAVNYSTLRNNLKAYCDKATDESETVIVTRKNEKNVVIMSLEKYNNLRERKTISTFCKGLRNWNKVRPSLKWQKIWRSF